MKEERQRLCEICVGNSVSTALMLLKSAELEHYTIRVINIDDKPCLITRDHCTNRINVMIKNGIIAFVAGMG